MSHPESSPLEPHADELTAMARQQDRMLDVARSISRPVQENILKGWATDLILLADWLEQAALLTRQQDRFTREQDNIEAQIAVTAVEGATNESQRKWQIKHALLNSGMWQDTSQKLSQTIAERDRVLGQIDIAKRRLTFWNASLGTTLSTEPEVNNAAH